MADFRNRPFAFNRRADNQCFVKSHRLNPAMRRSKRFLDLNQKFWNFSEGYKPCIKQGAHKLWNRLQGKPRDLAPRDLLGKFDIGLRRYICSQRQALMM